jgi:hypothetical protein
LVLSQQERVSLWGPYRIRKELYDMGLGQIARLESAGIRYKAVDIGYPASVASSCIHAISDLDGRTPRVHVATPGWGEVASYVLTHRLEPWIIDPCTTHPWVAEALGLGTYPVIHRDFYRSEFLIRMPFR